MKTLLRVDASVRKDGSHTRRLADYYQEKWLEVNVGGKVIIRDLAKDPLPHLTNDMVEAFQNAGDGCSKKTDLSDTLIAELKSADHLLVSAPLYNYSLPSTLKAYIDHVTRCGHTFSIIEGEYKGLLNTQASVITARSSVSSNAKDDFLTEYLPKILAFMGISCLGNYCLEATGYDLQLQENLFAAEKKKIDWAFSKHAKAAWIGEFSDEEKYAISEIRDKQAQVITEGNAQEYADLCADDIQLMIPSHPIISGKLNFLEAEKRLFNSAQFEGFVKTPIHVERQGNIAIEVGQQMVKMKVKENVEGVFSRLQKYVHVYRLTPSGWRYAILMSNAIE